MAVRNADRGNMLAGLRVLLVDDDEDLLSLVEGLLVSAGAQTMTATCGDDAFRVFVDERPELVVSDIQMPCGTGHELIRRIRALSANDGGLTPAIAVSGACGRAEALESGFHEHLQKPVGGETLLRVIARFVAA